MSNSDINDGGDGYRSFGNYRTDPTSLAGGRESTQAILEKAAKEKFAAEVAASSFPSFVVAAQRDMGRGYKLIERLDKKSFFFKGFGGRFTDLHREFTKYAVDGGLLDDAVNSWINEFNFK